MIKRKLLFTLFLTLSFFVSFGQFSRPLGLGNDDNSVLITNAVKAKNGFINKFFSDTIQANLSGLKYYPGGQAGIGNSFAIRDSSGLGWIFFVREQDFLDSLLNVRSTFNSLGKNADSLGGHPANYYAPISSIPINNNQLTNGSNYITSAGAPVQSVAGKTGIVSLVSSDVGLGNVDNTSDLSKPISTATQTALNGKANTATTLSGYGITDGVSLSGIQTITNKTISGASNTLSNIPYSALTGTVPTWNQNTTGTAAGLSANIAESQVTNLTTDLAAKLSTTTAASTYAGLSSTNTFTGSNTFNGGTTTISNLSNLGTVAISSLQDTSFYDDIMVWNSSSYKVLRRTPSELLSDMGGLSTTGNGSGLTGITETQVTNLTTDLNNRFTSVTASTDSSTLNVIKPSGTTTVKFVIGNQAAVVVPTNRQTYSTGDSVTVASTTNWLIVNPDTSTTNLTIVFPSTPSDGEELQISFGGTITSGTIITNLTLPYNVIGGSILYNLQVTDDLSFKYNSSLNKWYR